MIGDTQDQGDTHHSVLASDDDRIAQFPHSSTQKHRTGTRNTLWTRDSGLYDAPGCVRAGRLDLRDHTKQDAAKAIHRPAIYADEWMDERSRGARHAPLSVGVCAAKPRNDRFVARARAKPRPIAVRHARGSVGVPGVDLPSERRDIVARAPVAVPIEGEDHAMLGRARGGHVRW